MVQPTMNTQAEEPRTLYTPDAPEPTQAALLDEQRQTRETWELEMLISGAVTFGLLQLPAKLGAVFDATTPHLTSGGKVAILLGYVYASAIVYALIASFLIHLTGRAYWVGLIGLDSVFPHGPDWKRMSMGPIAQDVYRSRMTSLDATIARVDRFCRIIFSFGFLVVLAALFSILVAGLTVGLAWVLGTLGVESDQRILIAFGILSVVMAPVLVASLLDRFRGDRIDPASRLGRGIRALLRGLYASQLNGALAPIQTTLYSNLHSKGIRSLFFVTFFGAIVLAFASLFTRMGSLQYNSLDFFAEAGPRTLYATSYESMNVDARSTAPSLQSDIVRDPYVRLFVPFVPERHNAAIPAFCPGLRATSERGVSIEPVPAGSPDSVARPVLDCLARIHAVTLDSVPVAVSYRFHEHPRTGVRGIVAYLPVTHLSPGEHVLRIGRVPGTRFVRTHRSSLAAQHRDSVPPHVIPFWR